MCRPMLYLSMGWNMEIKNWEDGKEGREKKALELHSRLSTLFREDRLAFEREKRRLINEAINKAHSHEQKQKLQALQDSIDQKMRSAGSEHNRLVLMQKLFWDQVETFRETLANV